MGVGFCQPSSYLCRRCPAAASAVRACVALLSIMPIICGPILISSVSLPVAVLASAMCGIFCLRGPVLWLVSSSYVATPWATALPPVPSARSGQNRSNGTACKGPEKVQLRVEHTISNTQSSTPGRALPMSHSVTHTAMDTENGAKCPVRRYPTRECSEILRICTAT